MKTRTGYSFKTAVGHLDEVADRLKETGFTEGPISDRLSTFGFVNWTKECKEKGLRPIYGVELPVVTELGQKKPIADYWSFFAKKSMSDLHAAITLATEQVGGLTYYQALRTPGLIKISGERLLLDHLPGRGKPKDFYVALAPSIPVGLYRNAKRKGLKFLATSDNYYTRSEDKEFYEVTLGRRANTQTYPQHILSNDELKRALPFIEDGELNQAIRNREDALSSCAAILERGTLLSPRSDKTLKELCLEGAARLGCDLSRSVYGERLERELDLISKKGYDDYFFIVADLMQWSRQRMVVGPARGSSCGSLACYLLGITAIDPIPYDLIFERFIDITRSDMPDIDLDFSDVRRHMALEYVSEKYGHERVARLGSVNMFQAKSALNSVGAALKIPSWQVTEVSNTVVKRSFGDSRADSTVIDTLTSTDAGRRMLKAFPKAVLADRIEDHPASAGQHAAGVVLTQEPIARYVAVDSRSGGAMCDKYDAEYLNLLKIDMLGLKQLSIFERCLELIGEEPLSDYLEKIPLDDQEANDVLNRKKFAGVFQFVPGSTLSDMVKTLLAKGGRMENIDDYVAFTALVRPGPIGSGMTESWINRRCGRERIDYDHPMLEPLLRETLGLVVYQEQIMKIGRDIGGLSWEEVVGLRRAMGRSMGKEYFDQFGDPWKAGAISKGMPAGVASRFWDKMCQFGMFSFNKSHSVAYGVVSYWCCWLKAKFPVEFAAATLDAEDADSQVITLREMKVEGIDYVPIDKQYSSDRWGIKTVEGKRVLVGPLTNIRGVGQKTVEAILDARARGEDPRASVAKKIDNAITTVDSLTPIADAVNRVAPDLPAIGVVTRATPINEAVGGTRVLILARVGKVQPLDENEPSRVAKRKERLAAKGTPGTGEMTGATKALNFFFHDDTGDIFAKIDRLDYVALKGDDIVSKAKKNKSLFAVKGLVPSDFRMIRIEQIKYLGEF